MSRYKPLDDPDSRARKFTYELFRQICETIAHSDKGLRHICKQHDIAPSSFYYWLSSDTDLAKEYQQAREQQADYLAEQLLEIANDDSKDMITCSVTGKQTPNPVAARRSWIQIQTRMWIAARLNPRKYGYKVTPEALQIPEAIIIDWSGEKLDIPPMHS